MTDRASLGKALDRLYREVRLGIITPEMGRVLFDILCRVMDTDFSEPVVSMESGRRTRRGKAYRMRGKLNDLLTEPEIEAWDRAVDNAPAEFRRQTDEQRIAAAMSGSHDGMGSEETALPAAS